MFEYLVLIKGKYKLVCFHAVAAKNAAGLPTMGAAAG